MIEFRQGARFGDWTLNQYIAGGGNGIVWAATRSDGTQGAIKFLHPKHYRNNKRVLRFRSEIEAIKSCQDIRGVLPLLDDAANARTNRAAHWFVAALAVPVETILGADKRLQLVIEACASYAETLAEMHKRGFSHRDIKPENLFRYDDTWSIGDFGLVDFPAKPKITSTMEKLGPMFYIAPEMLNNAGRADGRSADVYSLAKTLWKLGTGQKYPLPGVQQAALNMDDLDHVIRNEQVMPPGVTAGAMAVGEYAYSAPGMPEKLRVTTDPAYYEQHADSL